jgi:hypothetical protein
MSDLDTFKLLDFSKKLDEVIGLLRDPNSNTRWAFSKLHQGCMPVLEAASLKQKAPTLKKKFIVSGLALHAYEVIFFWWVLMVCLMTALVCILGAVKLQMTSYQWFLAVGCALAMMYCCAWAYSLIKARRKTIQRYWPQLSVIQKAKVITIFMAVCSLVLILPHLA